MMSSAKRLCSSSSILIKRQWNPIVDDDYFRLPNFQSMIVARIKDRCLTSEILPFINNIYPWPNSLKHVRRIHTNDNNLDILLYPSTFVSTIDKIQFEKYFLNETRIINIPENPCLLKWQYDKCINDYWPNLVFKENQILEKSLLKKNLAEQDDFILDLLKKIQDNNEECHCAIIVDNENQNPLVGCRDYRHEHPLQHSTMIAIDLLAENSIYSRENLLEKFIEKKQTKKNYLLNGCSIYLTHEPCIMCAMALLHSRISTVYYLNKNQQLGALGSIYKLHTLKKTNHRFTVYQLEETNIDESIMIHFVLSSIRYSPNVLIHRKFSLSLTNRNVFKNLYNHFQYANKAKKAAQQRGIDLANLTVDQKIKLKPILRLQTTFRVVNFVMGLMAVIAGIVWYTRRKKQYEIGKEIHDEYNPIWMNLKNFKHRGAIIGNYLLPEQIIGKLHKINNFQFNKTDCICASFPKSGTTLIQEIVYLIETNFDYESAKKTDISERYSFIEWPTVNLEKLSSNKPRFFKTHLPPQFFNETFQKSKIIYIYRNPKDVTVSLFHFLRSINIELTYSGPWNEFVKSFLIDEVYYGPWWRHVNDYYSMNDSIFFVSYEELLTNFRPTVRRLASYLGKEKELTEEELDKLEKWCSFDSMKKNSKVNYNWFREWGFVDKSFSFLRKGEIGDWLNHFDVEQSKKYDEMVSKHISTSILPFNYGITSEDQQRIYNYYNEQHHS